MYFMFFLKDLRGMFTDLRPHDFGPLFFMIMWAVILFSSLKNVDRRDEIAQLTYMGVLAAFGVLFFMVFPIGRSTKWEPTRQIMLFAALLLIPSVRWMVRKKKSDIDLALEAAQNPELKKKRNIEEA